jgi:hypothetical protein
MAAVAGPPEALIVLGNPCCIMIISSSLSLQCTCNTTQTAKRSCKINGAHAVQRAQDPRQRGPGGPSFAAAAAGPCHVPPLPSATRTLVEHAKAQQEQVLVSSVVCSVCSVVDVFVQSCTTFGVICYCNFACCNSSTATLYLILKVQAVLRHSYYFTRSLSLLELRAVLRAPSTHQGHMEVMQSLEAKHADLMAQQDALKHENGASY